VSGQAKAVQKTVADIATAAAASLDLRFTVSPEEIIVFDKYVGEGYGVLTQDAAEAIALSARQEGLMLDPVYTGKAMAGLLDLLRQGYFGKQDSVMFLHTGGTPALFVYRDELTELLGRTRS